MIIIDPDVDVFEIIMATIGLIIICVLSLYWLKEETIDTRIN